MLNVSAWSTERKYIRRYKGRRDILLGIEHKLKKEEVKEQFNREAKGRMELWLMRRESQTKEQAVRIRNIHQEKFFVAVGSKLGSVVGEKQGAVTSIQGNRGRITQAWVNVRGGMRVSAAYFWHSEGWTPRTKPFWSAEENQSH